MHSNSASEISRRVHVVRREERTRGSIGAPGGNNVGPAGRAGARAPGRFPSPATSRRPPNKHAAPPAHHFTLHFLIGEVETIGSAGFTYCANWETDLLFLVANLDCGLHFRILFSGGKEMMNQRQLMHLH